MKNKLMNFSIDRENKKITVEREFAAPRGQVWAAWTQSEILDQWWAPKPWTAKTKSMDFTEGGFWLYSMVGPDGTEIFSRTDYHAIDAKNSYSAQDAFCDKNGAVDQSMPRSVWNNTFNEQGQSTIVHVEIIHEKLEDLEKIVAMGFKEGFTAGLENLDTYLASKA